MASTSATIDLAPLGARSIVAEVDAHNGGVGASKEGFFFRNFRNIFPPLPPPPPPLSMAPYSCQ